jgi:hypothetical protein
MRLRTGPRTAYSQKAGASRRPARGCAHGSGLARQVNHVVGEVKCDLIQRKVGVLDLLGEHDIAVAIVARKCGGSVGTYGEFPDLKFLGSNSLEGLNDRDFVEKPIRSSVLANVLRAVDAENVAVDPVPIPAFTAVKLREIAFAESLRCHDGCASFLEVAPPGRGP